MKIYTSSNNDSLTSLEYLLAAFDAQVSKICLVDPQLIRPCIFEELHEPFAGQIGDFSIHKLRFSYIKNTVPITPETLSSERARVVEHLNGLYHFAYLVEQEARRIFVDSTLVDKFAWFPSKIKFEQITEALSDIQHAFDNEYFRVRIVEGYIGDGKTALLRSMDTFDSELDYFYRAQIKENNYNLTHMPEGFFRIFALLGIYGAFCNSIMIKKPLFIDRSWISHEYFASHGKPRIVCDYKLPATSSTLDRSFFVSIFSWARVFRQLDTPFPEFSISEDVEFYFRQTPIEMPWPFGEHRKMEQEVYATQADLIKHYKQFYLMLNKYFIRCTIQTGDLLSIF